MKKREENYHHTHSFELTGYIRLSAVLMLIPVLEQIILRPDTTAEILSSMSFGTIWSAAVVLGAVLRWRCRGYRLREEGIELRSGVLRRKQYTLPFDRITGVKVRETPAAKLFGAVSVELMFCRDRIFSRCRAYLPGAPANRLLSLFPIRHEPEKSADTMTMLLTAIFQADPASGALLLLPFLFRADRLLGLPPEWILSSLDNSIGRLMLWLSPAARILSAIVVLAWGVKLLTGFLKLLNFSAYRADGHIIIRRGFFSRNLCVLRLEDISAITIDSTLLMHISGLCSASVAGTAAGRMRRERGLIVPAGKREHVFREAERLTGISTVIKKKMRPRRRELLRYLFLPALFLTGELMLPFAIGIPGGAELSSCLFLLLIPTIWWLIFRLYAWSQSFIAFGDGCIIVSKYSALTLRRYFIPTQKLPFLSFNAK